MSDALDRWDFPEKSDCTVQFAICLHPVSLVLCLPSQASFRFAAKTSGSVTMATVSLMCGSVMEMETAWMGQMKWIVQVGISSPKKEEPCCLNGLFSSLCCLLCP